MTLAKVENGDVIYRVPLLLFDTYDRLPSHENNHLQTSYHWWLRGKQRGDILYTKVRLYLQASAVRSSISDLVMVDADKHLHTSPKPYYA